MLSVRSNYAASVAHRYLVASDEQVGRSLTRLSSGSRTAITRDDPVGLGMGTVMRSNVAAFEKASGNISQGTSLLQVAEGGMATISEILVRARVLSVQAASDNLAAPERAALQDEFSQLQAEIDRVAKTTSYDGRSLLKGTVEVLASTSVVTQAAPAFSSPAFAPPGFGAKSAVANVPGVAQREAFDIGTVEVADVFKVTINGHAVSFTAATTTPADVAEGLATAIAADPLVNPYVLASVDADGSLVVDARVAGTAFTYAAAAVDYGGADTQTITSAAAKRVDNVVPVTQRAYFAATDFNPGDELQALVNGAAYRVTVSTASTEPINALNSLATLINASGGGVKASLDGSYLSLASALPGVGFTASTKVTGSGSNVPGAAAVAQREAFDVSTVEVCDVFTVRLNGHDVSFTATTTAAGDVIQGLSTAINADGAINGSLKASVDGGGSLVIDAIAGGTPFTFTASALDGGGADTQTIASVVGKRLANAAAIPQKNFLKPSHLAPGNALEAVVNGTSFKVVVGDTLVQPADALDALVAAINTGQSAVVASSDGLQLILEAAAAGTPFTASGGVTASPGSAQVTTIALTGTPQLGNRYLIDVDGQKLPFAVGVEASMNEVAKSIAARFNGSLNSTFHGIHATVEGNTVVLTGNLGRGPYGVSVQTVAPPAATESGQFRMNFQVGINSSPSETLQVTIDSVTSKALGVDADAINISTIEDASKAGTALRLATDNIALYRGRLGSMQNRLQYAGDNVSMQSENEEASRSAIMDLDVAAEMSRLVSSQVLRDLGVSMIAQANRLPQGLMKLFE